jgi:hypothetical protein
MEQKNSRAFWSKNAKALKVIFDALSNDGTYHEEERKRFQCISKILDDLSEKNRQFFIYDKEGKRINEVGINIRNIPSRLVEELDKAGEKCDRILEIFEETQNIISTVEKSRFKKIVLKNSDNKPLWVSQNIGTTQPNFPALEKAILENGVLTVKELWI